MPPKHTILLVEDDVDALEVYSLAFRHFGFNVVQARSGDESVSLASEMRPDLIVMDLGLPGMDGWQATQMLKSSPATAAIPVLALTVHVHDDHRLRAASAGCDSFVAKPCSPRLLAREIERMLHTS